MEIALKLSGMAAKHFALFAYAVLKGQKRTRGRTRLVRMLREQRDFRFAAQAYCAAYVVAQKFGVDVSAFHFDTVCKACADMDAQGKRGFISDVKRAAYAMGRDIQRSFREMEQAIQTDGFSVEDKKPARESKAKEDKEQAASR